MLHVYIQKWVLYSRGFAAAVKWK